MCTNKDADRWPTNGLMDLLDKIQHRAIPRVARSAGAADEVLPYLSGQKERAMMAKAMQAQTFVQLAVTKLYEAYVALNEIKRSGK